MWRRRGQFRQIVSSVTLEWSYPSTQPKSLQTPTPTSAGNLGKHSPIFFLTRRSLCVLTFSHRRHYAQAQPCQFETHKSPWGTYVAPAESLSVPTPTGHKTSKLGLWGWNCTHLQSLQGVSWWTHNLLCRPLSHPGACCVESSSASSRDGQGKEGEERSRCIVHRSAGWTSH